MRAWAGRGVLRRAGAATAGEGRGGKERTSEGRSWQGRRAGEDRGDRKGKDGAGRGGKHLGKGKQRENRALCQRRLIRAITWHDAAGNANP